MSTGSIEDEHGHAKATQDYDGTACDLDWFGVGDHGLLLGLGGASPVTLGRR